MKGKGVFRALATAPSEIAMPNWDDIRFLLEVARGGSMAAAAGKLSTNAATVSRRMQNLADGMGYSPLIKGPDGWRINPRLALLVLAAEDFDHAIRAVKSTVAAELTKEVITLKIGCPPVYSSTVLMPRLRELRATLPQVNVSFHTRLTGEGLGEFDMIIANQLPERGRLIQKKLQSASYGVMGLRPILPGQDWIGLSDALEDSPTMQLAIHYFGRPSAFSFTHYFQVHAAMLATGLPGILPITALTTDVFRSAEDPALRIQIDRWMCYHESRRGDPNMEALVKWLTKADRDAHT